VVGVVTTVGAGLSLPMLKLVSYVCQNGVLADVIGTAVELISACVEILTLIPAWLIEVQ
jgi:hypothetical protein